MAKKTMGGFDVLIDLAGKFVDSQKGMWDHTAWLNFLSEAQKKGLELSDEMRDNLGLVLESMKKFYNTVAATQGIENAMAGISWHIIDFFKKTGIVGEQAEFEAYIEGLQKKGVDLTDETIAYLKGIFESTKGLYTLLPSEVTEEKAKKVTKK